MRTLVPADDLRLPTATGVFGGTNWHERETHELFGVIFTGHPNLDRVVKPGPGAVSPGQSADDVARRPNRKRPPGVPDLACWGPSAEPGAGA